MCLNSVCAVRHQSSAVTSEAVPSRLIYAWDTSIMSRHICISVQLFVCNLQPQKKKVHIHMCYNDQGLAPAAACNDYCFIFAALLVHMRVWCQIQCLRCRTPTSPLRTWTTWHSQLLGCTRLQVGHCFTRQFYSEKAHDFPFEKQEPNRFYEGEGKT